MHRELPFHIASIALVKIKGKKIFEATKIWEKENMVSLVRRGKAELWRFEDIEYIQKIEKN